MATCNIKTTNKAYMVSVGALENGSAKVKNERLFDVHNANIRDAANQRYNLKTEELPFSKAVRDIPRSGRTASNYFIEWQFNDKFFDVVTPVVEMYKSMEDISEESIIEPSYTQTQLDFNDLVDDDIIINESPIRSTYPYEAEDYMADMSPEIKKELSKVEFKELNCNL
jgi:hypothetical protein